MVGGEHPLELLADTPLPLLVEEAVADLGLAVEVELVVSPSL
jgi:hypothetical protein